MSLLAAPHIAEILENLVGATHAPPRPLTMIITGEPISPILDAMASLQGAYHPIDCSRLAPGTLTPTLLTLLGGEAKVPSNARKFSGQTLQGTVRDSARENFAAKAMIWLQLCDRLITNPKAESSSIPVLYGLGTADFETCHEVLRILRFYTTHHPQYPLVLLLTPSEQALIPSEHRSSCC